MLMININPRWVPLISDSDRRVPADWGQERQASSWVEAWNSACLSRCPRGERPLVELYLEPGVFSERCTEKLPLRVDCIHRLAQEQSSKPLGSAIPGEKLNLLVGGLPCEDKDVSERIKMNVLKYLFDNYGITEMDLQSAEISAVPAFRARNIGFDGALIGAYGHDDRVCAYPALTATMEASDEHTVITILADKEEVGRASRDSTGLGALEEGLISS